MHPATIFAFATLVASAWAVAIGVPVAHDLHAYPQYRTSYGVADRVTGDQKAAVEVREGGITKGSYSFVQPDGVVRTVNYIVTPLGGFQAQVINTGVAGHPAILGIGRGIGARGLLGGIGFSGHVGSPILASHSNPVGDKVAAPSEQQASASENESNESSESS